MTELPKNWRTSREYRIWKVRVIRRDGVCQCCDNRKERHAHHIKSASFFPELAFDENNGVTLCNDCHKFIHNDIAGGWAKPIDHSHLKILLGLKYHRRILRRKKEKLMTSAGLVI